MFQLVLRIVAAARLTELLIAAMIQRIAAERSDRGTMGREGKDAARVTVTLTKAQRAELQRIARANGVTESWLIRRAVERLIEQAAGGPLLPLDFR